MGSFVSFPSVSSDPLKRGVCWETAKWLRSTFEDYGLSAQLLEGTEPVKEAEEVKE